MKGTVRIGRETRRLGNKRTIGDHPDCSSIKIGQNTEKRPGKSKRLAVIQAQVKTIS